MQSGEIVGLLGPNGAGKTTTIRMLTTYYPPSSGSADVFGHDILTESSEVRKIIGYMPETPPLYPDMRVKDFLRFVAGVKQVPKALIPERVEQAVEDCKLADVLNKFNKQLSKGYRQRVGLASCVVSNPKVLILDEPTSGLDPEQIIQFRDLLKRLSENKTILLSTHALSEVAASCTRAIIMAKGRIVHDVADCSDLEQTYLNVIKGV